MELFSIRIQRTFQLVSTVKGCIQVGLFNGGLYRKYRVLTSEDIQQNYLKTCCMLSQLPNISEELELAVS